MNQSENIKFDVHSDIMQSLVFSQSGTIASAIRELVMNSIDAGASDCQIMLNETHFSVQDNGAGFKSESDIKTYFKTFGQPHEDGDAEFGRFRIGRAQCISMGIVTWESNTFSMDVDVKGNGFEFEFKKHPEQLVDGCKVSGELYDPISRNEITSVGRELKEMMPWAAVHLTMNGKKLTRDPEDESWDIETDDFYIQWTSNEWDCLSVYNKGVLVREYDQRRFGVSGILNAKNNFKLNMARNEISDSDPLWHKAQELFSERAIVLRRAKNNSKRPSFHVRHNLAKDYMAGTLENESALNSRMFIDVQGKCYSLPMLAEAGVVAISPKKGCRKSDALATKEVAVILHKSNMAMFDAENEQEFVTAVIEAGHEHLQREANEAERAKERADHSGNDSDVANYVNVVDFVNEFSETIDHLETTFLKFERLAESLNDDFETIKQSALSLEDKCALKAIQYGANRMGLHLFRRSEHDIGPRQVFIGKSSIAEAWTDGCSSIFIEQSLLCHLSKGITGCHQIALLLLHEYLHNDSDESSHQHDFDFMKKFHDYASNADRDIVGDTASLIHQAYLEQLQKKNCIIPYAPIQDARATLDRLSQCSVRLHYIKPRAKINPIENLVLDLLTLSHTFRKSDYHIGMSLADFRPKSRRTSYKPLRKKALAIYKKHSGNQDAFTLAFGELDKLQLELEKLGNINKKKAKEPGVKEKLAAINAKAEKIRRKAGKAAALQLMPDQPKPSEHYILAIAALINTDSLDFQDLCQHLLQADETSFDSANGWFEKGSNTIHTRRSSYGSMFSADPNNIKQWEAVYRALNFDDPKIGTGSYMPPHLFDNDKSFKEFSTAAIGIALAGIVSTEKRQELADELLSEKGKKIFKRLLAG